MGIAVIDLPVGDGLDESGQARQRQWWESREATMAAQPLNLNVPFDVFQHVMNDENPDERNEWLLALDGDQVLGGARIAYPMQDNTHIAHVDVHVAPPVRGGGAGSALLEDVERRIREAGRRTALAGTMAAPGEDSPAIAWAERRGWKAAHHEEEKVVDLATSAPFWGPLDAEVAERIGDYRVVTSVDHLPEEYLDGFIELFSTFVSSIPLGDLPLEDVHYTPERIRQYEQRVVASGRQSIDALAIAPDGSVVGTSGVRVALSDPRLAQISITQVAEGHRGHALGLAMKLATHRELMARHPACREVATENANTNERMNLINQRMGYRVVLQSTELTKDL